MFTYYGLNKNVKKGIRRYSKDLGSAYELVLGEKRINKIKSAERDILIKDSFKPIRDNIGIRFHIDGKFYDWKPLNISSAPEIFIPNNAKFRDYLHEYNHFIFFVLQKFPMVVAEDVISHFVFPKKSRYKLLHYNNKKDKNYLLTKLNGALVALEEDTNLFLEKKVMKLINDPLHYFRNNHQDFEKGLGTLEWLINWEKRPNDFFEILKIIYKEDKNLINKLKKEKSFVYDFVGTFKSAKCRKTSVLDFDKKGNLKSKP